jgi:hypothetical protein
MEISRLTSALERLENTLQTLDRSFQQTRATIAAAPNKEEPTRFLSYSSADRDLALYPDPANCVLPNEVVYGIRKMELWHFEVGNLRNTITTGTNDIIVFCEYVAVTQSYNVFRAQLPVDRARVPERIITLAHIRGINFVGNKTRNLYATQLPIELTNQIHGFLGIKPVERTPAVLAVEAEAATGDVTSGAAVPGMSTFVCCSSNSC